MSKVILTLLGLAVCARADWTLIPPPPVDSSLRDKVLSIAFHGKSLWGLTERGLFRSPDSGRSWEMQGHPGLPGEAYPFGGHSAMSSAAGCLFLGTQTGVFRACGPGAAWEKTDGLELISASTYRIGSDDGVLIAGFPEIRKPYFSVDTGRTWRQPREFLPDIRGTVLQEGTRIWNLGNKLHLSVDSGRSWTAFERTFPSVELFASCLGRIWIGPVLGGLESSLDYGRTWQTHSLPVPERVAPYKISGMVSIGNALFATPRFSDWETGGVFMSVDSGRTWTPRNAGLPAKASGDTLLTESVDIQAQGRLLVTRTVQGLIYRSADLGATWARASQGLPATRLPLKIQAHGKRIFAATWNVNRYEYFLSEDSALSWNLFDPGFAPPQDLRFTSRMSFAQVSEAPYVYSSRDDMATWQPVPGPWEYDVAHKPQFLMATDDHVFIYTNAGLVVHFADGGRAQAADSVQLMLEKARLRAKAGKALFRSNGRHLEVSTDGGVTWAVTLTQDIGIRALAADGNAVVALARELRATDDGGLTWRAPILGSADNEVHTLTVRPGQFLAGTRRGLWVSQDGMQWQPAQETGLSFQGPRAFAGQGDNLVALTNLGIFYSLDRGQKWQQASIETGGDGTVPAALKWTVSQGGRFFAASPWGVWTSIDSGRAWNRAGRFPVVSAGPIPRIQSFPIHGFGAGPGGPYAASGSAVHASNPSGDVWKAWAPNPIQGVQSDRFYSAFAGVEAGVYGLQAGTVWFHAGDGWAQESMPGASPYSFLAGDGKGVAAASESGIWARPERSSPWLPVAAGLPESSLIALALDGSRLYAGTFSHGLWMNASLPTAVRPGPPGPASKNLVVRPSIRRIPGGRIAVRLELARPARMRLSLHTATGRAVAVLDKDLAGGSQELRTDSPIAAPVFFRLELQPPRGRGSREVVQGRLAPW